MQTRIRNKHMSKPEMSSTLHFANAPTNSIRAKKIKAWIQWMHRALSRVFEITTSTILFQIIIDLIVIQMIIILNINRDTLIPRIQTINVSRQLKKIVKLQNKNMHVETITETSSFSIDNI